MEILVVGSGCEKCGKVYNETLEAVRELNLTANVRKVEDLVEIVKLGVMSAPALIVDGKLLAAGQPLSKKRVIQLLEKNR